MYAVCKAASVLPTQKSSISSLASYQTLHAGSKSQPRNMSQSSDLDLYICIIK